jgi:5-amino-6-(5-phosphoribosylamino)uracil reductase
MKIIGCLASTLDGKIASVHHPAARFGSPQDLQHLQTVRNQADAILCGGETFRQYGKVRKGNQQTQPPLQCIVTQHMHLPPKAAVFHEPGIEGRVIVFSPTQPEPAIRALYPAFVQWHAIEAQNPVDSILDILDGQYAVKTLLIEGGGQILSLFLEQQKLDELYLTICPVLLGGVDSPGLLAGKGFRIEQSPSITILSRAWYGDELFLHLSLN